MQNIKSKIRRFFPDGVITGLLFFVCLFILSLLWNSGFSVMGVQQSEVTKLVFSSFWIDVLIAQIKIFLVYLTLGFIFGWVCRFVTNYFPVKFKGQEVLLIFLINAYFLISSIKKYPQLYVESFYSRGAPWKNLQLFITDVMPEWVFIVFGIFLAFVIFISIAFWLRENIRLKKYLTLFILFIGFAVVGARILKTSSLIYSLGPSRKNAGKNLLVIVADSFRADRLGSSSYFRNITPNIDKIAQDGITLNSNYSSLPRTFPEMISFLSGKLPVTHGVRHMFPNKWERNHESGSLADILRKNGYSTAVVSDFAGDIFSRMQIGFDRVKVPYFNFVTLINQRSLEIHCFLLPYIANSFGRKIFPELKEFANNGNPFLLADETISILDDLTKKDKFFCLAFFSTLHFPYASPYPYYEKYTMKGYNGRFKYHKPPTLYEKEDLDEQDINQIRGLYDGSVESFDCAVGRIIDFLKKKKCFDNTIIVITADHGENLYENGWYIGHGEHLRGNNVLKTPLIIRYPKPYFPVKTIDCLTRDIDFAPTILDYLGYKNTSEVDGVSLMPLIYGRQKDVKLTAFSETGIWFSDVSEGFFQKERIMYPDITGLSKIDFTYNMEVVIKDEYEHLINIAKHRMVDDGTYRLIYIPTRDGVKYELFNIRKDPAFKYNLYPQMPSKADELKKQLFSFMAKDKKITFKNNFAVYK